MKNTVKRTVGGTILAILMLAIFAQISVSAQDKASEETTGVQTEGDLAARSGLGGLEGSWSVENTRRNCQTGAALETTPGMYTFMFGGTLQEFNAGTAPLPLPRGPGHGVWNHLTGRRFYTAVQFFRYNADGTFAGRRIIRQYLELHLLGNSYTGTAEGQVLDVNGNVIMTNCATLTATRFQ